MNLTDLFKFKTDELTLVPNQGGDVKSVDLLTFVDMITFRESLNQMFIEGSLTLTVPKGYFSSLNIYLGPSDALKVSIRSFKTLKDDQCEDNDVSISDIFIINKISKVEITSQIYDKYNISFISPEGVKDKGQKIQKSFSNVKRSDAIKTLYDTTLKVNANLNTNADTDNADFCCVIPNWSPSKSINWFLSGCYQNDIKNFYFFQRINKEGKIETVFENYKTLCEKDVSVGRDGELASGYISSLDSINNQDYDPDTNYKQKMKFTISEPIIYDRDMLQKSMSGVWSSKVHFYDITSKKYTFKDFNYKDQSPKPLLNRNDRKFVKETDIIQLDETLNSPESSVFLLPKARYRFSVNESLLGSDKKEDWFQEHISQKETSIFNAVVIEVPGDSQRSAGETVLFSNLIRNDYNDRENSVGFEQDNEGKEMGAKYLIFQLERTFEFPQGNTQPRCLNRMILVRDGITD